MLGLDRKLSKLSDREKSYLIRICLALWSTTLRGVSASLFLCRCSVSEYLLSSVFALGRCLSSFGTFVLPINVRII